MYYNFLCVLWRNLTNETVSYLVMGKGNFTLDDGTQIEAGRFNTNKKGSFGEFNFSQGFQYAPVVLAGVTSFNETKHRKYSIQLVDANRDLTYRAAKLKTIYHISCLWLYYYLSLTTTRQNK